jgi:ATP-dependent Clp protease protease subunit
LKARGQPNREKNRMGKFYSIKKIRAQTGQEIGRIDLYGEISSVDFWGDEKTPSQFIEELNKLGTVSEIEIHIFSNGGDPFAALAMYSVIKRRKEKTSVYIDGIAASAATLILCAGDTVYMDETSMLMVHNPYQFLAFAGLNAQEARELADELDKIREPMITAYAKKSNKTREEVIALMDGTTGSGTWLTASEAIEFGLADEYTPENKKPLEVAALIKPGVYNYQGNRIDLTRYEEAAEKTAGIINSKRGGNSMGLFKRKPKKVAAKVNPKAAITFVEMVCPSCNNTVNLNPETGEIFAGGAAQAEPQGGTEKGDTAAAKLARRMPGNVKASIYSVNCPHCGNDFVWDTDVNADGDAGTQTTKAVPFGGASKPAPAQSGTEPEPVAEAAQAVCPECGAQVDYDTETAETGTDEATGEEGYLLTCPECNTQFLEPLPAAAPEAVPAGASAEVQAAYRAGIAAERNRQAALDEMVQAAPGTVAMIQAAKKSGASVEAMSRNVIKAMASGTGGSTGASQFAAALGRDVKASGVNGLRTPRHAAAPKSVKASAYEKRIEEYNKARGGRDDA